MQSFLPWVFLIAFGIHLRTRHMLQPAPRSLTIQFNNAGKVPESFMYTKHFSFIAELFFFLTRNPFFLVIIFKQRNQMQSSFQWFFGNRGSSDKNVLFRFVFFLSQAITGLAVTRRHLQPDEAFLCCVAEPGSRRAGSGHRSSWLFRIWYLCNSYFEYIISHSDSSREERLRTIKGCPPSSFSSCFSSSEGLHYI